MARSKTSSSLELLVELDRQASDPLHRQLERAIRAAVREGRLEAGTVLPSSRALASQLGVSRGIVVESYEQLVAEGYLVSRSGGATRVARATSEKPRPHPAAQPPTFRFDFRPGRPDVTEFPLGGADADAVVVTAAHQYPTGAVLPPARRAALVEWADRRRATIIEDDYDAEFRYDREPIGAIQGLSPSRVVYAGSASKVLAPGLRLGWLILPERLVEPVAAAKVAADMGSASLDQLAFADFLSRGELDHHLRRMRPLYRRRRDALLAALARHLPDLRPTGASAGLHVLAWLPGAFGAIDTEVVEAAAEARIGLGALSTRRVGPGPDGLIFGYGAIDESSIDEGIRRLARAIGPARGRPTDTADRPIVAVYGTLRRGERNHALIASAELLGEGTIAGRWFGLPANSDREYGCPAFVPGADGKVAVELYRLPGEALLARLDELEAYDPADEPASEYIRRRVRLLDGPVDEAWAYTFAGALPAWAEPIRSGDWLDRPDR